MVPSSSQLADALIASVHTSPDTIDAKVHSLVAFLKKFHLAYLMPEIRRHIMYRSTLESVTRGCHITTALPLDDQSRDRLLSVLNVAGDAYTMAVDEDLIGGALVANKGILYDASLRTSLERLRIALKN
ncbi:F0F1 ATP synthase subunit delta [Candidatus Nomurabacteria bacterium]|nr:F0F1 ATP synthase subunit delta [Candidatus Nomurabacteria bacterium]